ncbi:hypothetical protein MPLB_1400024 [Mesorhizobium sp. ORS 3324]|nr:hypothetical protein MPLB_1400024 [Mesorhizobium sp. ORS 3324]
MTVDATNLVSNYRKGRWVSFRESIYSVFCQILFKFILWFTKPESLPEVGPALFSRLHNWIYHAGLPSVKNENLYIFQYMK